MKMTKSMRKKTNGMNKATLEAFEAGAKHPLYQQEFPFLKLTKGIPYVNVNNFQ
jgi:hypothetical protein